MPLLWVGLDELPVVLANQFIGQAHQDEIVVSIGCLVPPPIVGETIDERREHAQRVTHVPVRSIVRLSLTRRRVEELQTMLGDTLRLFDGRYEERTGNDDETA